MRFRDRRQAGRELAARLRERQDAGALPDPLVLALPRGGVAVAAEVAEALGAPSTSSSSARSARPATRSTASAPWRATASPCSTRRRCAASG